MYLPLKHQSSDKQKKFKFRLPLLRNGTFHGELEGSITRVFVKNASKLNLDPSETNEDVKLEEFLEYLEASPVAPEGCGCAIA